MGDRENIVSHLFCRAVGPSVLKFHSPLPAVGAALPPHAHSCSDPQTCIAPHAICNIQPSRHAGASGSTGMEINCSDCILVPPCFRSIAWAGNLTCDTSWSCRRQNLAEMLPVLRQGPCPGPSSASSTQVPPSQAPPSPSCHDPRILLSYHSTRSTIIRVLDLIASPSPSIS